MKHLVVRCVRSGIKQQSKDGAQIKCLHVYGEVKARYVFICPSQHHVSVLADAARCMESTLSGSVPAVLAGDL